jgi:hypothetical protein
MRMVVSISSIFRGFAVTDDKKVFLCANHGVRR